MEQAHVTCKLAQFAGTLTFDFLPPEVVELVKLCIIDQIGVQLAISTLPIARVARSFASIQGSGPATVMGGSSAPTELAAFANGVSGHAFELDDIHWAAFTHPGAAVVPAALAVCEEVGAPGKSLIEAVTAGYEVMLRIAVGLGRQHANGRRLCPLGELGAVGSAVGAGRAWGLSPERLFSAIGLAASHALQEHRLAAASELQQAADFPEVLRWAAIHYGAHTEHCCNGGLAAMGGVQSALLVRAGFVGPESPLIGEHGLASELVETAEPDRMLERLASQYVLLLTGFKTRPYAGAVHAVIDKALEALAAANVRDGEELSSSISRVAVGQRASHLRMIQQQEDEATRGISRPGPLVLRAPLANALIHGGTLESVRSFDPTDPSVVKLANKVVLEFDEACEAASPKSLARVRIEFQDGRVSESVGYQKGSPDDPLTADELHTKFIDLASHVMPRSRADQLLNTLKSLELIDDVRVFRSLLSDPDQSN
jgi:2-methylcitrate dehydratase PrpD